MLASSILAQVSLSVMVSLDRSQALACSSIIEGTTTEQYAGIDVSLECASDCVVDAVMDLDDLVPTRCCGPPRRV